MVIATASSGYRTSAPEDRTFVELRRRRVVANAALPFVLLGGCALIVLPPGRFSFWPACPIREYFGVLCPGCGATHALAALLRGHLLEALRENALAIVLLPFAIAAGIRAYLRAMRREQFTWHRIPTPALTATLVAVSVFTLMRNIPH